MGTLDLHPIGWTEGRNLVHPNAQSPLQHVELSGDRVDPRKVSLSRRSLDVAWASRVAELCRLPLRFGRIPSPKFRAAHQVGNTNRLQLRPFFRRARAKREDQPVEGEPWPQAFGAEVAPRIARAHVHPELLRKFLEQF